MLQPEPDLTQFSPPPGAPCFLSDLFANDFTELDDLRSQVNHGIINDQHSSLSLTSKSGIIESHSKYPATERMRGKVATESILPV